MVVGFTTTDAIGAYHHWCCEFDPRSGRGVQHYVIVCQWLLAGQGFSPGPPVSSTNKTDHHNITEILLKVALNFLNQIKKKTTIYFFFFFTDLHDNKPEADNMSDYSDDFDEVSDEEGKQCKLNNNRFI